MKLTNSDSCNYLLSVHLNIFFFASSPQGNFSVGILDMAGFENFANNSFEQFCINIANERLHTFFNEHVLEEEQRQYEEEGVKWRHITYSTNEDLLNMLMDVSCWH